MTDTTVIAVAAFFAAQKSLGRKWQSVVAAFGLVAASGVFVHLSGGVVEVHFHYFVVVVILSLYEDWIPFLVAISFVVIEHGAMGVISPRSVYDHQAALNNPWKWALIHGGFVLAESVACLVAWRKNEDTRVDLQQSLRSLSESEERFRSLVQNASDIAILFDRDAKVRYASPSMKRVLGYDPADLLGGSLWNFVHPDDLDFVFRAWVVGVAAGEHLVTRLAARLATAIRPGDSVPRFGDDEFVVLCEELDSEREALAIADRLNAALTEHFCVEGRDITVTASVGIATTALASGATADALV